MISGEYVLMMTRYNAWQNRQIMGFIEVMDEGALRLDRGAFFGSIMNTLNHILWGDTMWMSRFSDAFSPPQIPSAEHINYTPNAQAWTVARKEFDARMSDWAAELSDADLSGDLTWTSGMTGTRMTMPRALCVAHLFSHQTHHRGQVHAMLTAAGSKAPVTDLCFMPEDA